MMLVLCWVSAPCGFRRKVRTFWRNMLSPYSGPKSQSWEVEGLYRVEQRGQSERKNTVDADQYGTKAGYREEASVGCEVREKSALFRAHRRKSCSE
jgi:hypothetical protein